MILWGTNVPVSTDSKAGKMVYIDTRESAQIAE